MLLFCTVNRWIAEIFHQWIIDYVCIHEYTHKLMCICLCTCMCTSVNDHVCYDNYYYHTWYSRRVVMLAPFHLFLVSCSHGTGWRRHRGPGCTTTLRLLAPTPSSNSNLSSALILMSSVLVSDKILSVSVPGVSPRCQWLLSHLQTRVPLLL